MKAIAVIPARLASTRLARKMLRSVLGKPLIGVVYEAVRSSPHRSGTERVHEISSSESAEVYINVQGDEPLVRTEQIASLLQVMENPAVQGGTLMTPAADVDIANP